MASKAPMQFRAIARPEGIQGQGPLNVQHSSDGVNWFWSVNGIDESFVRSTFTRLQAHGAVIVDTDAYKH